MDLRKLGLEEGMYMQQLQNHNQCLALIIALLNFRIFIPELISDLDYRELGFKGGRWMQLNNIVPNARLCY